MRQILRFINFPAILLICAIGLGITTSLFQKYPLHYFQPDLIPLFIIWTAANRTFAEGGFLSLGLGYLFELFSGVPQGVGLLGSFILFFLFLQLNKIIFMQNRNSKRLTTIAGVIFFPIIILSLSAIVDSNLSFPIVSVFSQLIIKVPIHYAISLLLFRWLDAFDIITEKQEVTELDSSEEFA